MLDPSEHQIQATLVELLTLCARPGVLWLAIPNGGDRHAATGAKLKREGVRAGAADMLIIHNGAPYFLELKRKGGRSSPQQCVFAEQANAAGAEYRVASSVEQAIGILRTWDVLRANATGRAA